MRLLISTRTRLVTLVMAWLTAACGGGHDSAVTPSPEPVWQGGSASLQFQVFASHAAGVLSDPPLAYFNYLIVPTPNVAIENWLPKLVVLPPQAGRCETQGPVYVLSVYQGNQDKHYVDENHAACGLAGVPADAQAIASQDMQTLQGLLASYEQEQAQRVADARARIEACSTTVPTVSQGVYGCFYTATDVVTPYSVNEDVRPNVNVAVFAASTPLDSPSAPLAQTTSNVVGYYELALASGRYLFCTGNSQPSTGICETITIATGQLLRRSYSPGSPPVGTPSP